MRFSLITKNIASCTNGFALSLLRGRRSYPATASIQAFLDGIDYDVPMYSKSLDLGCGNFPRNPFGAHAIYGIDVADTTSRNTLKADLSIEGIPFPDNTFDFCTAYDFLEHIPRLAWPQGVKRLSFIELFNEIHRVLVPGGLFLYLFPAYPASEAFQDPTHVNFLTESTVPDYFCRPGLCASQYMYGFNSEFSLLSQAWINRNWIVGVISSD